MTVMMMVQTNSVLDKPIYDVLVGPQKTTKAFTSLFSFTTYLKDMNSGDAAEIRAIIANEEINEITDIYGSNRQNNVVATTLPLYKDLTVDSSTPTNVCVSTDYGIQNKLNNHKYIRFTVNYAGSRTISVEKTSGNDNLDPDFALFNVSPFQTVAAGESYTYDREEKVYNFTTGEYLLDVYDSSYKGAACFDVKVSN